MKEAEKLKIMELHLNVQSDGEEYTMVLPEGLSRLTAAAHMFRAAAEGLLEFQEMFIKIKAEGGGDSG